MLFEPDDMALFNKDYLKSVALIEKEVGGNFQAIATGFVIGFLLKDDPDPSKRIYNIFLLTNRHVFQDADVLYARFDQKTSGTTKRFPILLQDKGQILWLAHKDSQVDIALLAINPNTLDENDIDWGFIRGEDIAYPEKFEEIGIALGDGIFLAGFPMGLSGLHKNYAIVRSGVLARLDEEIINSEKAILADATVFPGNSGGPVFIKPEQTFLNGSKPINQAYLIGVVSGYRQYQEPLYSHQSNPPSVAAIAIENSGLASIVPMNFARDIYNEFLLAKKGLEKKITGDEKTVGSNINVSIKH